MAKAFTFFFISPEDEAVPAHCCHSDPAKATLEDLDRFLRAVWLECCGHMSSFEIAGESFISEQIEPGDRSMSVALEKVMAAGMKFEYIYDFGTSTELPIKVISARKGIAQEKEVCIMARNEPPEIKCDACSKPATRISLRCAAMRPPAGSARSAGNDHGCGEDMLLPVVNSCQSRHCAGS